MIYLDYSATTLIHPEVLEAMIPYLTDQYGNASSHYSLGQVSKNAIENTRETIASYLGCSHDEIYFTSGGTESNNWDIKRLKNRYHVRPMHIVSSNIEHHSITAALESRKELCHDMVYTLVPVEKNGIMNPDLVGDAFKLNTRLCSIMMVNNEIGTIQPTDEIASKCYDNGVLMHVDAVQAFGNMPIDVKKSNISLLSASGHKLGCIKGIGILYISNDCKSQYVSFMSGGQQEMGMRAGTENVAAIVGLGKALEISLKKMKSGRDNLTSCAVLLESELRKINGVHLNVPITLTDLRHFNIRIDGIRSEELMSMLDAQDIYVSAGSACNSDSGKPSHVLTAIGLSEEEANSSIRVSISEDTTIEEVETFVQYLKYDIDILKERTKSHE